MACVPMPPRLGVQAAMKARRGESLTADERAALDAVWRSRGSRGESAPSSNRWGYFGLGALLFGSSSQANASESAYSAHDSADYTQDNSDSGGFDSGDSGGGFDGGGSSGEW